MNHPSYTVRPFREGDEERILALFNLVFGDGDDDFKPRTRDEWNWEFRDNPAGNQIVVAESTEGEIIAQYACLPIRASMAGETVVTGQGIDSMVHPDWRRGLKKQGPFLAVATDYFERWGNARHCGFGYGFPNKRAFRIGVRLIGYKPVDPQLPALYRNFFEHKDDADVGSELDLSGVEVARVPRFGSALDELWERTRQHLGVALIRDAAYWNWRYVDCPYGEHQCFEIRDSDGLRGAFVTRPQWQGIPIQALSDYLGAPGDKIALAHALRTTSACGRAGEQARVEAWFPKGSQYFADTLELGFGTEPSQVALCLMLYRDDVEFDWFVDHWYYTIGDCDVF